MHTNILEIKNLSLILSDKKIINNLSLNLWTGHIHALMGTNGAGKSTLVSTIMGLYGYENYKGDIFFKGKSLKNMSIDKRAKLGITLAWQEPARFEGLKIKNFLLASAKNKTIKNIKHSLQIVGLNPDDYIERSVDKTLSGGERKKVELASLLLMEPDLAMIDEPDSGIDLDSIKKIFDVVKILRKKGTTILFITHSLAVLNQAEHAFLICKGQIIDKGTVKKIARYFKEECVPCKVLDPVKKRRTKNAA